MVTNGLPVLWGLFVMSVALFGRPLRTRRHWTFETATARTLAVALINGLLLAMAFTIIDVRLGLAAFFVPVARRVFLVRRRRRQHNEAITRELPDVIDLLRLSLRAGGSVTSALGRAAGLLSGPVSSGLQDVCTRVDRGQRLAEGLDALAATTNDAVRPLARALAGADRHGTELSETLERLAAEARASRRRAATATAQRVPVRLLVPLVVCILPAFILLTLVPTLAGVLLV